MNGSDVTRGLIANAKTCRTWLRNSLPKTGSQGVHQWYSTDTEDRFRSSPHAILGPNSLDYRLNENGMRTMPMSDSDPSRERLLFVGCSHTFGVGVPVERRWPTLVTHALRLRSGKSYEEHVIASPGWTNHQIGMAVAQAVEVIRPVLCIVLFTTLTRCPVWSDDWCKTAMVHSWAPPEFGARRDAWNGYMLLRSDAYDTFQFLSAHWVAEMACRASQVPWLWHMAAGEWYPSDDDALKGRVDLAHRVSSQPAFGMPYKDYGRDNVHPGIASHKYLADAVMQKIECLGLE